MTKKKSKEADEPRFEVKKRQPREKPNFFQNIPSFQHPLAEILNFPSENSNKQISEVNTVSGQIAEEDESGHPEFSIDGTQDKQTVNTQPSSKTDTHAVDILDTQNVTSDDTQSIQSLDTQIINTETLKSANSGQPEYKSLSAEAPELKTDAPRKTKAKGAPAPKSEKVLHPKNEEWRKYDKARSTVRVNLHVDREIDKKVRKYCFIDAEPKVELREFYERAAVHLLNFLDTQNLGSLSAETPLDDRRLKMMFKTKPFIINLYLRYNTVFNELSGIGKKWTARWSPRDDEAATRYNELSPDIIELGILQTQIQKGLGTSRIQTFKYYVDEIENVLGSGVSDEMLKTILEYHRQIWKKQTGREVDLSFLEEA